ncbi:unnamed protein product, partial [marine sediment metagenome]
MPPCYIHEVRFDFETEEERQFYRQLERSSLLHVVQTPVPIDDDDNVEPPPPQNVALYRQFMFEILLRLRQSSIHPALALAGYKRKFNGNLPLGFPTEWPTLPTKVNLLCKLIRSHREEKALVFCEFKEEMPYLQRELRKYGVRAARYDGSLSIAQRQVLVKALQWNRESLNSACRGLFKKVVPDEILDQI